jgi:DnaK suppressor protein
VAKKTTKKKTTKKAALKKTTKAASKKVAKKTTKKKAAASKPAKMAAPKKKPTTKKKTTKKAAETAASKTKKKKTTKKVAEEAKASAAETPVNPEDNGKHAEAAAKPAPQPIRRVVRPNPPAPVEPEVDDWTPLSDAKLRKVKTGLTRKDLEEFRQLLLEKRAEIVGDVMGMEEARSSGNGGDLSNMPLHMADIGSDNYEQEFTLGLVESERKLLVEIDRALKRIQDKTYGVCIITGNPIPKARLEIKPWAKYSIEVVRQREKRGLHSF